MKKTMFLVLAMVMMTTSTMFAVEKSEQEQVRKERAELVKLTNKDLHSKVDRSVKQEAKRLTKEGWVVSPGSLPLEKQLERSYTLEYEYDENLFPKYIIASAQSIGENYDAAKTAATTLAITNLAGQIQTEVTALVENTVANKQLVAEEAASISETVMSSKNIISQNIKQTQCVLECYRTLKNKNKEVLVRIAYNGSQAKADTKQAVRDQLEQKGQDLHDQLDKVLGFDKVSE